MKSPPAIKKRAGRVESHGAEPKAKTDIQESANIHTSGTEFVSTWHISSFDDDGLDVFVGAKGHVNLKQTVPFERDTVIVLHPRTARALQNILPDAIAAAVFFRKGTP